MNKLEDSEVDRKILTLACEDYTGLYEIIWSLNTLHPEIGETEKIAAATTSKLI
jgi:hypothetical protein